MFTQFEVLNKENPIDFLKRPLSVIFGKFVNRICKGMEFVVFGAVAGPLEVVKMPENRLSEIVCGWVQPKPAERSALAKALDAQIDELFEATVEIRSAR